MEISTEITLNVDLFLELIKSILVLLAKPLFNSQSLTCFQLELEGPLLVMMHLYVGKRG